MERCNKSRNKINSKSSWIWNTITWMVLHILEVLWAFGFIYYVYIEILIIAGLKEGWVGFPILVFIIIYFAFYKAPTALMREAKKIICLTIIIYTKRR